MLFCPLLQKKKKKKNPDCESLLSSFFGVGSKRSRKNITLMLEIGILISL